MNLEFSLDHIQNTEFGVGRDDGSGQPFVAVPVNSQVQAALRDMVSATWEELQENAPDGPAQYEPSEKHSATEYLYVPLNNNFAESVRLLHNAVNLPLDGQALANPTDVFSYFVRMTDNRRRHLTAIRRATQFKGILKARLMRFVTDTLQIIEDRVFKLDTDFDLLVDSDNVHILHPNGFEFVGRLQEAVRQAVPQNISAIHRELPFVEFGNIQEYASGHTRAARYLASINGSQETRNVNKRALKKLCKSTGVEVTESSGIIHIQDGHEIGFLEVLDRRRYTLELVRDRPERFKAGSRRKLES